MQTMTRSTNTSMTRRFAAIIAVASLALSSAALLAPSLVLADGDGSPEACKTDFDATGNADLYTYTAPDGGIVTGVCIKSGANMFGENKHSDVLGNGTYENECYEVSGVGTSTVTVERIGDAGPSCQALSHIDVVATKGCGDACPVVRPVRDEIARHVRGLLERLECRKLTTRRVQGCTDAVEPGFLKGAQKFFFLKGSGNTLSISNRRFAS